MRIDTWRGVCFSRLVGVQGRTKVRVKRRLSKKLRLEHIVNVQPNHSLPLAAHTHLLCQPSLRARRHCPIQSQSLSTPIPPFTPLPATRHIPFKLILLLHPNQSKFHWHQTFEERPGSAGASCGLIRRC